MQNWEYTQLRAKGDDVTAIYYKEPDFKMPIVGDMKEQSIVELLDKYGSEGWELVSVTVDWTTKSIYKFKDYYLKRPLAN